MHVERFYCVENVHLEIHPVHPPGCCVHTICLCHVHTVHQTKHCVNCVGQTQFIWYDPYDNVHDIVHKITLVWPSTIKTKH